MTTLCPLQCKELENLRGYLDAARRCFTRGQEDAWLEVHLFELPDAAIVDDDVLRITFPRVTDCLPWVTVPVSLEDMIATAAQLFRILPFEQVEERQRWLLDRMVYSLCNGLWSHVEALIDFRDVVVHAPVNASPYGATFTFIIRNARQKRLLVFAGGSE